MGLGIVKGGLAKVSCTFRATALCRGGLNVRSLSEAHRYRACSPLTGLWGVPIMNEAG